MFMYFAYLLSSIENEMKRKISRIKDIELEKSEAILKSKQEKLQNLEEKFSLLMEGICCVL